MTTVSSVDIALRCRENLDSVPCGTVCQMMFIIPLIPDLSYSVGQGNL